jgi:hypothetical protein
MLQDPHLCEMNLTASVYRGNEAPSPPPSSGWKNSATRLGVSFMLMVFSRLTYASSTCEEFDGASQQVLVLAEALGCSEAARCSVRRTCCWRLTCGCAGTVGRHQGAAAVTPDAQLLLAATLSNTRCTGLAPRTP